MKKIILLMLVISMLCVTTGCSKPKTVIKEVTTGYESKEESSDGEIGTVLDEVDNIEKDDAVEEKDGISFNFNQLEITYEMVKNGADENSDVVKWLLEHDEEPEDFAYKVASDFGGYETIDKKAEDVESVWTARVKNNSKYTVLRFELDFVNEKGTRIAISSDHYSYGAGGKYFEFGTMLRSDFNGIRPRWLYPGFELEKAHVTDADRGYAIEQNINFDNYKFESAYAIIQDENRNVHAAYMDENGEMYFDDSIRQIARLHMKDEFIFDDDYREVQTAFENYIGNDLPFYIYEVEISEYGGDRKAIAKVCLPISSIEQLHNLIKCEEHSMISYPWGFNVDDNSNGEVYIDENNTISINWGDSFNSYNEVRLISLFNEVDGSLINVPVANFSMRIHILLSHENIYE